MNTNLCMYSEIMHFIFKLLIQLYYVLYFKIIKKSYDRFKKQKVLLLCKCIKIK